MEEIHGSQLHQALGILGRLECDISKLRPAGDASFSQAKALSQEQRRDSAQKLEFVREVFFLIGLTTSGEAVSELQLQLRLFDGPILKETVVNRLQEVSHMIRREMNTVLFMLIRPEQVRWYESPRKDWEEVVARWPRITIDIEELSRCFACDRYAGAIFHALLVAEFGLIQVSDLFNVSGDKPGWGCLERLQRIRDKGPKERSALELQHFKFLENTLPLLQAVKDSWRHKISHIDNRLVWLDTEFGPQVAEEIILTIRGLMRRLAHDLPVPH